MPERGSFVVDCIHHQRATADELGRAHAAFEGVFYQTGSDAAPCPSSICRKLAQQQTRHWIGRLAGPDGSRHDIWHDRCGCQTIISDHAIGVVNDQHGGEALLLIGESTGCQPVIERRLAAGKLRDIVVCGKRFGDREGQGSALRNVSGFPGRGPIHHFYHLRDGSGF